MPSNHTMSKFERISKEIRKTEGEMIRNLIKLKKDQDSKYTQGYVANLIGRDQTALPQWLSGATPIPDLTFITLSSILGFNPLQTRPHLRVIQQRLNEIDAETIMPLSQDAEAVKAPKAPQVPVLTASEAISFLDAKRLPAEFKTIDAVQTGIQNAAFALLEETDQFEPAIQAGARYTVLPMKFPSNPMMQKIIGDRMAAARLGNEILIGRIKLLKQGKIALLQPDGTKEILENGVKDLLGLVLAITSP